MTPKLIYKSFFYFLDFGVPTKYYVYCVNCINYLRKMQTFIFLLQWACMINPSQKKNSNFWHPPNRKITFFTLKTKVYIYILTTFINSNNTIGLSYEIKRWWTKLCILGVIISWFYCLNINFITKYVSHHKLTISRNFIRIHVKIIKQYVYATLVGFKV
jgi:hypothetical protein